MRKKTILFVPVLAAALVAVAVVVLIPDREKEREALPDAVTENSAKKEPEVRDSEPEVESYSPRVLTTLPDFSLTDQGRNNHGRQELHGKVWIANFIFTRCRATCPAQTIELSKIQRRLQENPDLSDVQLVSISVDPEFDTPEVLTDYAGQYSADTDSWSFLTGSRAAIWELSRNGFLLPVDESAVDATSPITHSPQFILVDRHQRIRGYYNGLSEEGRRDLLRDLHRVLEERKGVPEEIFNPP